MKLIVIPPYQGMNWTPAEGHYMLRMLVERMQQRGQLEGVEITIDEGYPLEAKTESRDEAVYAEITAGFLRRVKMHSEGGLYDAIISSGGYDVGFYGARMTSKIPITYSLHSAVHVASLIGDRFSYIATAYTSVVTARRSTDSYGLGQKFMSGRYISYTTTKIAGAVRKKQAGQVDAPEVRKLIDDLTTQCIAAIEEDRADSLLFVFPGFQCFEDEVRQNLDESGYSEIPIICALPAAVEMARAMVNMKLIQAPRAYPSASLKAKPKFG